jgi:hypothetical protein
MVLGWIEEDGNWTEITGQIPFSTASAPKYDKKKDFEALKEFIEANIINLPLDFKELYILGISGKTFLTFKISGTENTP